MKRMPKNDSFVNTPDGPGNVCSVDLLREEAKVRLDDAPESPRNYKGCELQTLRNGKGSREGIEIPAERPARYVPAVQSEPVADKFAAFDFTEQPLTDEEDRSKERSGRRRSRGGRGRSRGGKDAAQKREGAQSSKKGSQEAAPKVEKIQVKSSGGATAEMKAAADRRAGERRSEKRPSQEKKKPKAESAAKADSPVQTEGGESGAAASHRRRRPRRRRSGGSAPAGGESAN